MTLTGRALKSLSVKIFIVNLRTNTVVCYKQQLDWKCICIINGTHLTHTQNTCFKMFCVCMRGKLTITSEKIIFCGHKAQAVWH
jgi:hypothetical protein